MTKIGDFYNKLQGTIDKAKNEITTVRDLNARVGNDAQRYTPHIGTHGEDITARNGKLLLKFCIEIK